MSTVVTTQAELDAALAALGGDPGVIEIRSPRSALITLADSGFATVWAHDAATVVAYSGRVRAYDAATVRAHGPATVWAYDAATVWAHGSATVRAYGSATVRAYGSATVWAHGPVTVEASPHVAVHLHDARATITGGVLIDLTQVNDTAEAWCEHHGVEVRDGKAVLHKAVHEDWQTGHEGALTYAPGSTVLAEDFSRARQCGGGLHLCPQPWQSQRYLHDATRYVACEVNIADLIPLDDKCKVREVRVLCEVDVDGERVSP